MNRMISNENKHDSGRWLNIIKTHIQNGDLYRALNSVKECEDVLADDYEALALVKDDAAKMILEIARSQYLEERDGVMYASYRLRYYKYLRVCRKTHRICQDALSQKMLNEALSLGKREYYPKVIHTVWKACIATAMSLLIAGIVLSFHDNVFLFRQLPLILMITSFLVSIFGKMPKWKINKHIIEGRESLRSKIVYIFQEIAELSQDLMGLLCNLIATIIGFALFALLCAGPCYLLYLAIPYVMREIKDLLGILILIGIIQSIFGIFDAIFGGLSSLGWLFLFLFLDSSKSNHRRW